jgi:hypothetical protein
MIIGISGRMQVGKSTLAEMLRTGFKEKKGIEFGIKSFADILKEMTCVLLKCTRADLENAEFKEKVIMQSPDGEITPRKVMQLLGTEFGRKLIHHDLWVDTTLQGYTESDNWIIPDVRFPNEFRGVSKRGGFNIRIYRYTGLDAFHESELAMNHIKDHEFQWVIHNNDTLDELKEHADAIIKMVSIFNKKAN